MSVSVIERCVIGKKKKSFDQTSFAWPCTVTESSEPIDRFDPLTCSISKLSLGCAWRNHIRGFSVPRRGCYREEFQHLLCLFCFQWCRFSPRDCNRRSCYTARIWNIVLGNTGGEFILTTIRNFLSGWIVSLVKRGERKEIESKNVSDSNVERWVTNTADIPTCKWVSFWIPQTRSNR